METRYVLRVYTDPALGTSTRYFDIELARGSSLDRWWLPTVRGARDILRAQGAQVDLIRHAPQMVQEVIK